MQQSSEYDAIVDEMYVTPIDDTAALMDQFEASGDGFRPSRSR